MEHFNNTTYKHFALITLLETSFIIRTRILKEQTQFLCTFWVSKNKEYIQDRIALPL